MQQHRAAGADACQQCANMLLTPAQMRAMEKRYMDEEGVASIGLMERAAQALTDVLIQRFGTGKAIFFACGPGGNGGDGLAAARLYKAAGGQAAFALCGEARSPDAVENLRRAREAGVREIGMDSCGRPDVWVDALFGTGLSRALSGEALGFAGRINGDRARGSRVVAVDIPSGISGLSGGGPDGGTDEGFVRADITITFQCPKIGHYLDFGLVATGELVVADIGIPAEYLPEKGIAYLYEIPASFRGYTFPRNTHKGGRGHVLIVAGSMGMAGAAALCAGAALRSGAGLVTVACPASIVPILQVLEPCAMCVPLPEKDGALSAEAAAPLRELAQGKAVHRHRPRPFAALRPGGAGSRAGGRGSPASCAPRRSSTRTRSTCSRRTPDCKRCSTASACSPRTPAKPAACWGGRWPTPSPTPARWRRWALASCSRVPAAPSAPPRKAPSPSAPRAVPAWPRAAPATCSPACWPACGAKPADRRLSASCTALPAYSPRKNTAMPA